MNAPVNASVTVTVFEP
ncbi:predicted protein [Streptomyces iranensis]|uniref:Uncharacterized protein n=1 Tax=Streptomyces iranensis TaxID=576784 RepID=A0A061A5X5_9ACTN|nr:predicted protein [Streptomyces iranensis]